MPEFSQQRILFIVGGIVGVVALLLVILLPMSFVTLEYHEMGFRRQKSTGSVDTSLVYTGGKYFLGPDFEFKVFKADAHFLELNTRVFTADKLEVTVSCHIQYFLRQDELPILHGQFDIYYENVMETSAIDALKGAIPVYNTRELVANRSEVEQVIFKAIRQRLGGICCRPNCETYKYACPVGCKPRGSCVDKDKGLNVDVKYFQLTSVDIPGDVKDRFMEALVLKEKNLREKLYQESSIIRKETDQKVKNIKNEAAEIQQNGTVQSQKIKVVAEAEYTSTIEKARSTGLRNLYSSLGISDQAHKNSFDYLRTLRGLDGVHLTVDFQQRIAGNLP